MRAAAAANDSAHAATVAAPADLTADDHSAVFLRWLLASAPAAPPAKPAALSEATPVALLDAALAAEATLANLLPRAAQIVPQLMKSLRDDRYSATEIAQRISRDVVLKTEVLRLANSVHYGAGREPVVELAQAVATLGTDGLQRAIAKVVLRPIFESRSAPLSLVAAPRIWQVSEDKARLCVALAPAHGVAPLDAYLAGLLHDIGWTAAMRIFDVARPAPSAERLTRGDLAAALFIRRDRLFGRLVRPWQLSEGLVALATELGSEAERANETAASQMLAIADRLAIHHSLQRAKFLPAEPPALLQGLPESIAETYRALSTEPASMPPG